MPLKFGGNLSFQMGTQNTVLKVSFNSLTSASASINTEKFRLDPPAFVHCGDT